MESMSGDVAALRVLSMGPKGDQASPDPSHERKSLAREPSLRILRSINKVESIRIDSDRGGICVAACKRGMGVVLNAPRMHRI